MMTAEELEKIKTERLSRTIIQKGAILDYCHDEVKVPNGHVLNFDFIKHQGAAAVVPVTEDGKLLLVRQYRNALDRFTLEIPAGGLEGPEEPTIEAAARELEEETGYTAEHLELLYSTYPAVAYSGEKIDVYLATGLKPSKQHLDEDEFLTVEEWSVSDLLPMIYDGRMQDAKTMIAVLAVKDKLGLQ
ncbi:MAG: NUDIX hydrolase [Lachnospiraceae bacterium]|nr:NUDIX hydrolase [Lachnospiraceae bacterium]